MTSRPLNRSLSLLDTPSGSAQGEERAGGGEEIGHTPDKGIGTQVSNAPQLSLAHSLFSEELGRIAIVNTTAVRFPAPSPPRQPPQTSHCQHRMTISKSGRR